MMTRVGPMDRFDICHAYLCWLADNHGGQWSREYARLCRLSRYFTPGMVGSMTTETRNLYKALSL